TTVLLRVSAPVKRVRAGIAARANSPLREVLPRSWVALARVHQSLDLRTVEVAAHHAHSFAVAPVQLAVGLVEMQLFRGVRAALGDDRRAIPPVEIDALDGAVVSTRDTHIGPVDVPAVDIDHDAVGDPAIG